MLEVLPSETTTITAVLLLKITHLSMNAGYYVSVGGALLRSVTIKGFNKSLKEISFLRNFVITLIVCNGESDLIVFLIQTHTTVQLENTSIV